MLEENISSKCIQKTFAVLRGFEHFFILGAFLVMVNMTRVYKECPHQLGSLFHV